jgi:hypothetical protein
MLGNCHIPEDEMKIQVGKYLSLKAMILLSMTSRHLRNFVDFRFREALMTLIQSDAMPVHMFYKLPISWSDPGSHVGKIFYKASKKSLTRGEQLQTSLAFHTIDGMQIPLVVETRIGSKWFEFSNFEITAAYMPAKKPPKRLKHQNTQVYTFHLKSTTTIYYNLSHHAGQERGIAIHEPDTTLMLEVKNAIVRDKMNLRKYYAKNCLFWCGLCKRNMATYFTGEELEMVERRNVCKMCLREFCVSLNALQKYGMRFNKQRAREDVEKIEISYVVKQGRGASVCKMMYKQDLAEFAGFLTWETMVRQWPGFWTTRRLKKDEWQSNIKGKGDLRMEDGVK